MLSLGNFFDGPVGLLRSIATEISRLIGVEVGAVGIGLVVFGVVIAVWVLLGVGKAVYGFVADAIDFVRRQIEGKFWRQG